MLEQAVEIARLALELHLACRHRLFVFVFQLAFPDAVGDDGFALDAGVQIGAHEKLLAVFGLERGAEGSAQERVDGLLGQGHKLGHLAVEKLHLPVIKRVRGVQRIADGGQRPGRIDRRKDVLLLKIGRAGLRIVCGVFKARKRLPETFGDVLHIRPGVGQLAEGPHVRHVQILLCIPIHLDDTVSRRAGVFLPGAQISPRVCRMRRFMV